MLRPPNRRGEEAASVEFAKKSLRALPFWQADRALCCRPDRGRLARFVAAWKPDRHGRITDAAEKTTGGMSRDE